MAYDVQLVVDSAHPHTLADWWAETLGWPVEASNEEFIRDLVAKGHAAESDTMTHRGVLVWRAGAAIRHPEETERGHRRRILFQLVAGDAKTVKNRMHLDFAAGPDGAEPTVRRLIARGATLSHTASQGPFAWTTLLDPEGNEFCVS